MMSTPQTHKAVAVSEFPTPFFEVPCATRAHLHKPHPAARVSRALVPLPRQVARSPCSRAASRRRRGRRAHPRARSPPRRLPATAAACSRGRAARALRKVPALGAPKGGGMQVPGRAARGHHPRACQGASRASNSPYMPTCHTGPRNLHLCATNPLSARAGRCWR